MVTVSAYNIQEDLCFCMRIHRGNYIGVWGKTVFQSDLMVNQLIAGFAGETLVLIRFVSKQALVHLSYNKLYSMSRLSKSIFYFRIFFHYSNIKQI